MAKVNSIEIKSGPTPARTQNARDRQAAASPLRAGAICQK